MIYKKIPIDKEYKTWKIYLVNQHEQVMEFVYLGHSDNNIL